MMASMTICDICNKPINNKMSAIRLMYANLSSGKVIKTKDIHEKCAGGMDHWMHQMRENSSKFKSVNEIRRRSNG